jgi:cholinesterase
MFAYAWNEYDPIIAGIIAQSGTATMGTQLLRSSGKNDLTAWYSASAKVGCGGKEKGEETVKCMRTKDFKQILDAISVNLTNPLAMGFGPTPDEKMVFKDAKDMGDRGAFHKIVSVHLYAKIHFPLQSTTPR